MPLTARHRDGRRIDSTDDEHWREVHLPSYAGLFCPECRSGMHARAGSEVPRRIRHFAHNPGAAESCSLRQGESEEHRHLKVIVAQAVRALTGWTAEIEHPGDGWRADVLAVSPSGGRRIAFEPQLSSIHEDTARERTRRHAASGVETAWLDKRMGDNLAGLPRVRLHCDDRGARVTVWAPRPEAYRGGTAAPLWGRRPLALDRFVRDVCLNVVTYDDGFWANVSDRADMARLSRAAWELRKVREAEEQVRAERVRVEREAARARTAEAERRRAEALERDRPRLGAEAERRRAEDVARRERYTAEAERQRANWEARAQREQAEREAERAAQRRREESDPWRVRPDMADGELLALTRRFLAAEKPFPRWIAIGDRLHSGLARRDLLHD